MEYDLKKIKKDYGENMMILCRKLFPTILETPGLLYQILSEKFHPTRFLYDDIINNKLMDDFIGIIMSEFAPEEEEEKTPIGKTPAELLKEKGYTLYECKTEEDIQSFRHYYKREDGQILPKYVPGTVPPRFNGEELCTFNGDRLDRCYVFFAVKDNADQIKREDYIGKEERQDPYGTSVISIQFTRGINNTISIKNRYNHTVAHPDATFENDLDSIIEGLDAAFEETYGLNINGNKRHREFPGYVLANDGRYYKYNFERWNYYYCPDNIIIDYGEVTQYDKSRYLLIENFILDFKEKEIYANIDDDDFTWTLPNKIESIKVEVDKETKEKTIIINEDIIIVLTPRNEIKSYKNPHITKIENNFLANNTALEELDLPNVTSIGSNFLQSNLNLKRLNIPKCETIGKNFLSSNDTLEELDLPNVTSIDNVFLIENNKIKKIELPNCKSIGDSFLGKNSVLEEIYLPEVTIIGNDFLHENNSLKRISLPKCESIYERFLYKNNVLEEIYLPEVKLICNNFLQSNNSLKRISLPKCEFISSNFLLNNKVLEEIYLPECEEIEDNFLNKNQELESISLPKCKQTGNFFLGENTRLKHIVLPECEKIGTSFLLSNEELEEIILPKVENIGHNFLCNNEKLNNIYIPNCKELGSSFLERNKELEYLDISSLNISAINYLRNFMNQILPNNNIIKIKHKFIVVQRKPPKEDEVKHRKF